MLLEISLHELQLIYLDSSCPQMSSRIFLEVSEYFPSSKSIYGNYFIFGCNRKIFSKEKKKPILRSEFCPYGQQGLGPARLAAACFRVLAAVLACTAWMHGSASRVLIVYGQPYGRLRTVDFPTVVFFSIYIIFFVVF